MAGPIAMKVPKLEGAALALQARRKKNKGIKHIDNASLHAGSPMYFYCHGCGAEMVYPEGYTSRSFHCTDCLPLLGTGLLED